MEKEVKLTIQNLNCNGTDFSSYLDQIISLDKQMDYPWSHQSWLDLSNNEYYFLSVMFVNKLIIGFSLFSKIDTELHLLKVLIEKSHRGNGYGHKLLNIDLNENYVDSKSCFLEVREDNNAAIHLYKKLGFDLVHTVNNFYSDGCSASRMSLTYSNT